MFGDGQAKPRAAVLSRGRSIRLAKGREELLLGFQRDADPGIVNREANQDLFVTRFALLDTEDHFPAFGKLHRVVQQVDDYLSQPSRVAKQTAGVLGSNLANQLDSF